MTRYADMTADEITREMDVALERDPRQAPFGAFVHDPFPIGVGTFGWYETREDLEAALLDAHPHVGEATDLAEAREAWAPARAALAHLLTETAELTEASRARAGEIASSAYRLDWWGTFDDLCGGPDAFAVETRGAFRGHDEGGDATRPIEDQEIDAFIDFVRTFGF